MQCDIFEVTIKTPEKTDASGSLPRIKHFSGFAELLEQMMFLIPAVVLRTAMQKGISRIQLQSVLDRQ